MSVADIVAAALILLGSGLTLIAGIGLNRFDDVFARMHAATKAVTLGLLLVVAGAGVATGDASAVVKFALVAVLQFVTAPVAAHMVGRAAYRSGTELSPATVLDELADEG